MWSQRKEEPLGGNAHYGRTAKRKRDAGESFPTKLLPINTITADRQSVIIMISIG
jgi:hypothetical protein